MCNMYSTANSLFTIADSIAIEILNKNTILSGVGNELHLHDNKGSKVLDIRLKNKIHGIVKGCGVNARKLLIYGEKEFVLLEWLDEKQFVELYHGILSDWIITGIFLENEPNYVLLTAHSVLLKFDTTQTNRTDALKARISCEDKSTLYCAHISGKCWKDLIIFGGNAFGELLIWQPIKAEVDLENEKLMKAPLLRRLTAHNGVVFSIDFKIEKQLLITTSDDRSVRFWNIQIETDWLNAVIKPAASGFSHMARVFQGKIFEYENSCYALTVGEDSYFCLWHCNGELLFKHRHQFGAVIWNFAYDNDNQIIYTVGSTGNIQAFSLKDIFTANTTNELRSLPIVNVNDDMEYAAKIKFLTESTLIGITNRNRLMLHDLEMNIWKEVSLFKGFKCTVLEVFDNLIALCGYKQAIVYEFNGFELKEVFNSEILCNVIRSFHFLSREEFLLSDDAGNCIMLKLQHKTNMKIKYTIELPKCKERWLTAAILINQEFLLVSNRLGNLLLYSIETTKATFELKDVLKHPHGYLGATFLKLLELNKNYALIQSAGHDCTLKTLKIDLEKATIKIQTHQNTPIAWLEDAIALDACQSFLGFNDNHFVVWSTQHDISLQVPCGGGHRCWHFYCYENHKNQFRIRLAFIKNKKVFLFDHALFNVDQNMLSLPKRNTWHTRPCNILEIFENKNSNELIIISAGDDNLIKLTTLDEANNLRQRAEIFTHISNIRTLKILSINDTKCFIFSGGGRAQLCLNEIDLQNYQVCELSNFMLKSVENSLETKGGAHSFDPETRVMSIDVQQNKNLYGFEIYLACSDGYLRKLKAIQTELDFKLQIIKEFYYGKCLLQVRLVANKYLLTAATDGIITIFDLNLEKTFLKLPIHASGINALDIHYDIESEILSLLTGGDDQAVNYAKICFKNEVSILIKTYMPQLHTAQVTAAKFSNDAQQAYTSGVDQNLIQFDLNAMEIKSITHSCIADIKGLTMCSTKNLCLLYGCGLQILKTAS